MTEYDVVDSTEKYRQAVDALAPLPAGPVKKALSRFADTIVERSS